MRPHPPLIPHFQLPTDVQANNKENPVETNQTLKRFMYKKAKLSEPFGKCKKNNLNIPKRSSQGFFIIRKF